MQFFTDLLNPLLYALSGQLRLTVFIDSETDEIGRGRDMVEFGDEILEALVFLGELRVRGHGRGERQGGGEEERGKLQAVSPEVGLTIEEFVFPLNRR